MRWLAGIFLSVFLSANISIAQTFEERSSLASDLGWVRFGVSAGRIRVANPQARINRVSETANPLVGTKEEFRLNFERSPYSVDYLLETPTENLSVKFATPDSMQLEQTVIREPSDLKVELIQPRKGPLELTIANGEQVKTYRGDTLWHLLLSLPRESRDKVVSALESLRPDWNLSQTAEEIEFALLRLARNEQFPDRRQWKDWAMQLGSPQFIERRAAERKLREAGPAIVPFLASIDTSELETEPRLRISRLLETLASGTDDTPERIAAWLVGDQNVWLTILASDTLDHRKFAKARLEALLKRSVSFDPAAAADVRNTQIDNLRQQLLP